MSQPTPPPRYLRRLQEAAAAAAAGGGGGEADSDTSPPPPVSPHQNHNGHHVSASPSLSPTLTRRDHTPFYEPASLRPPSAGSLPPSRYPIAADGYAAYSPVLPSPSYESGLSLSAHPGFSPIDTFSTYPLHNWSYKSHQSPSIPSPKAWPPLSTYYRPHRLEEIAPRETFSLIIALFFDFVFPLTPCVHKPSFMADLAAHREERDPLFWALVLSLVASTLVQCPRSYIPMERPVVRKLAQTCYEASRFVSVASYDPPTSTHVSIRYL